MVIETSQRKLYREERKRAILTYLEEDASVRVSDIAERLDVTQATVRKDIRELEAEGLLIRTHGGAVRTDSNRLELSVGEAAITAHAEKERIGSAAAQMVSDGDAIFIQSGTTCLELVRALGGRRDVTLITSDLLIAMTAERVLEDGTVIQLGGSLRSGYHYTQGPEAVEQLLHYHVPKSFLCCNAFSFEQGFCAHRIEQAKWVQTLASASDYRVMLLDSSKIGAGTLVRAIGLEDIDCLITDTGATDEQRARFANVAPDLDVRYV